jgi:hypothetical protein
MNLHRRQSINQSRKVMRHTNTNDSDFHPTRTIMFLPPINNSFPRLLFTIAVALFQQGGLVAASKFIPWMILVTETLP